MPELSIDNRTLIPVRLIPFVTGWKFHPDLLVTMLAKSDKWYRVYIPSFHLGTDNTCQPMLPKEWDVFIDDLEILSDTLHAGDSVEGESYPDWRKRSIEVIPESTFVWLDDLIAAYQKANSQTIFTDERPGDYELNLQPHMVPEMRKLVFKGFGNKSKTHNYSNYIPQQNLIQDISISFNELHHYMQLDPFYGMDPTITLSIVNDLHNKHSGNDLIQRFDNRFSRLPCKGDHVRHLIYFWCGFMQLPAYLNGSRINWQREDFIDNWTKNFDLNLDELKSFLRANNWPLPVMIFPNEMDNTQNKVSLDKAEYERIFNDFADKLPKLVAELAELKEIQPANMKERQLKKDEITNLEKQIDEIRFGVNEKKSTDQNNFEVGSSEWRSKIAKKAANAKHDKPGGSREKKKQMRDLWYTGKYDTKDRCAEEECGALNISFSAARKALTNLPKPK